MADIKIYCFDEIRGRGEFLRLLLIVAGQKFDDVRIKLDDWKSNPELKKASPYGQLPYVIYKGKKHGQSIAMATYFAKKFGFYGKTEEDALKQEEVMHLVEDLRIGHIRGWFFCQDAGKKAELEEKLKEEAFPRFLRFFETILAENGGQGYFVGAQVTLADLYVFDMLETVVGLCPQELKNFPLLQKLDNNVKTLPALQAYLAKRPNNPI